MSSLTDFLPRPLAKLVAWSNNFDTVFTANATAVGGTSAQATAFHTLNLAWANLYAVCENDLTRSPANIISRNAAKDAMIANARMLAKIIQAYPATTDTLRSQFGLNVRKIPGPSPAPGTPYGFKVELGSTGVLNLSWKNKGATACVYNIYRRLGAVGPFVSIGGVGEKKFADNTVPAGTAQVQYQIQAVRSTGLSDWALYTVNLGMERSEAPVSESVPANIAA